MSRKSRKLRIFTTSFFFYIYNFFFWQKHFRKKKIQFSLETSKLASLFPWRHRTCRSTHAALHVPPAPVPLSGLVGSVERGSVGAAQVLGRRHAGRLRPVEVVAAHLGRPTDRGRVEGQAGWLADAEMEVDEGDVMYCSYTQPISMARI